MATRVLLTCVHTHTHTHTHTQLFEDARDSPLEQRISDSILKPKDNTNLFSLVPSGVPRPPAIMEASNPEPISSPDCFSDFLRLLGEKSVCGSYHVH